MQSVDIEAKNKKEAIALACKKLSTTPEQLDIEIIEGPGMLMSLFSSKKIKIRATRIASMPEKDNPGVEKIQTVLETIVDRIQADATVDMEYRDDEILYTINGDGSGIFIGKHGQTLEAIQYLAYWQIHHQTIID